MAKEKEKKIARDYYINQLLTAKEISEKIGVTEKTIGNWVDKGNWKQIREAKINNSKNNIQAIKSIIGILSEERLEISRKLKNPEINKEDKKYNEERAVAIADEISKWNKTLENLDKSNRINFTVYLEVMERIFKSLQMYDKSLYMKTIDFQEEHVNEISETLS